MSYASRWESAPGRRHEELPAELVSLQDRIEAMPPEVRAELEPLILDALEQAKFRGRVLTVAREALDRMRLDLAVARFDLDVTRCECTDLRRRLGLAG
jgi:hypothetical protein